MAELRLLHFVCTLEVGGVQTYLAAIARYLDPRVFAQTVIFANDATLADRFPNQVPVIQYTPRRVSARNPRDWLLLKDFLSIIRHHRPNVATTQGAGIAQLLFSLAAKLLGVPVVHTIQHAFGNCPLTERFTTRVPGVRQLTHAVVDRYVALGSYYADDQIGSFKIPPDKLFRSNIGVELTRFRPDPEARRRIRAELGIPANVPVLGNISRHMQPLRPKTGKGIERALDAFVAVRRLVPEALFVLVGDGPRLEQHKRYAQSLNLNEAVMFTGRRTDASDLLNAFDVVVQSTYNPINGIVSIEGMACGRPIITIVDDQEEARMAADTCKEGFNGHFIFTDDVETGAERLAQTLVDPPRIKEMGEKSRSLAQQQFDINAHVRDLQLLYRELAHPRGALHRPFS